MPAIAAHSMISALGCDVAVACAAARAGLVRAAPIPGLSFTSDVSGEAEPLIAHAVPLLTHGFRGRARLLRSRSMERALQLPRFLERMLDVPQVSRRDARAVG